MHSWGDQITLGGASTGYCLSIAIPALPWYGRTYMESGQRPRSSPKRFHKTQVERRVYTYTWFFKQGYFYQSLITEILIIWLRYISHFIKLIITHKSSDSPPQRNSRKFNSQLLIGASEIIFVANVISFLEEWQNFFNYQQVILFDW